MALGMQASSSSVPRLLSSTSCLPSSSAISVVGFSSLSSRGRSVDCAVATESVQGHTTQKVDPWVVETRRFRSKVNLMRECIRKELLDSGITGGQAGGNCRVSGDEYKVQEDGKPPLDVPWSSSRLDKVANETSSIAYDRMASGVEALTFTNPDFSRTVRDEFYTGSHREVSSDGTTEGMHKQSRFLGEECRIHLEYSHMMLNFTPPRASEDSLLFRADSACSAERNVMISEGKQMAVAVAVAAGSKSQEVNTRVSTAEAGVFRMDTVAAVAKGQLQYINGGSSEVKENKMLDSGAFTNDQLCTLVNDERRCVLEVQEIEDKSQSQSIENKNSVSKDVGTAQMVCSAEDVLIVDNPLSAKDVVNRLRGEYKNFIHACDTEVADIDVKKQSPVGHGELICFSIYCGPEADFGDGKSCVWVDVLDNYEVLAVFKEYFEDTSIKKVWHNFSFDKHTLANRGIKATGFYADTMHLARLWNTGRKGVEGGYSLESLSSDEKVMNGVRNWGAQRVIKKTSMKDIFGANNVKKDGTEGKIKVLPSVRNIQTSQSSRDRWICYSAGDAICTWLLWESLCEKLKNIGWVCQGEVFGNMYDFYSTYWLPFGELLAEMENEGMLVDRDYLAKIERIAAKERELSISRFRQWAAKHCPDAKYINVTSDSQIRQLLFGGFKNVNKCRIFKVPNTDGYIEEGKKSPKKFRSIEIHGIGLDLPSDLCTVSGLPATSMQALKALAGKVSIDCYEDEEETEEFIPSVFDETAVLTSAGIKSGEGVESKGEEDLSLYGTAYLAFKGGQEGKEACRAIAAVCEVSAIDTLISSFIKPLQDGDILGCDGRVHCSLNLNTETGRLSARRPNLQNQPALEKDRYKIRQAFIASPGNSLIVADYGQLELRLLAHLANCKSMLKAFEIGGDFHSRTAMNMYEHVRKALERGEVLLEWEPKPGEISPPCPLLKDVYGAERRKAKMLNFSIAYGKTAKGLAKDWKVTLEEAQETVNLWYRDRHEVREWQGKQKIAARQNRCVHTILGRARHFPDVKSASGFLKGHIDRAAINTPVQGSAADVAMLAMLEITRNEKLKKLGWKLLLQVHDEMILEGPTQSADAAKDLVVKAMSYPFEGKNKLNVELAVDAKYANSWYAAK